MFQSCINLQQKLSSRSISVTYLVLNTVFVAAPADTFLCSHPSRIASHFKPLSSEHVILGRSLFDSFDHLEASTPVRHNETHCADNFSINILELDMFVRVVVTSG